ncbi:DUF397 domain-containing protein [Actinomadura rayongensis]|uniref:DUF397 domain-containing protein n=1 Tax=Actinomadura rayongensis TaxID=1429076 RepID=A0A6I4VXL9_9ACTN|nr:DUF397 domain-containing protein [Actinomadura rayongensis]MXQ62677.1 DUF397 domain-containing protein [Actinomadura rayongensis]
MREEQPSPVRWLTSSRCGASHTCVAVARLFPIPGVGVRDTAETETATALFLTPNTWNTFLTSVRNGDYDHRA